MSPALDQRPQPREGEQIVQAVDDVRLLEPPGDSPARTVRAADRRFPRAGAIRRIQWPMKSPGDSGAAFSANALTPPQWAWPSTTMCLTLSAATPNSSAAETPWGALVRRIGRHDVGDVAHDEELARARVENDFRRDARVAAADHHDFRRLPAFRELAVAVLLPAQTRAEKRAMSLDETWGNGMLALSIRHPTNHAALVAGNRRAAAMSARPHAIGAGQRPSSEGRSWLV